MMLCRLALQSLYAKFILIYPLDDDPPYRANVQYYRNNVPSESQKIFIPVFEFPFLSWNANDCHDPILSR